MGRRRRRSRGGGVTRRRFLAGGLLGLGGASILGGTQAFSQADATRAASIETAGDGDALLGIDTVQSVKTNVSGQDLVTLTNNTDRSLSISLSLTDPNQGSLSTTSLSLVSGESRTVSISVDADSPTGTDALSFSIEANGGGELSIALTRSVAVVEGPALLQQIYDESQNTNAEYAISYRVQYVDAFDHVEIDVENLDAGHIGTTSYENSASETTLSYPPGGGSDGGAQGDTYEFRFRVYDADGHVSDLDSTVQDVADGDDPPGDDLSGPNSSTLESFTVQDDSQNTNTDLTLTYQATDNGDFDHVSVTFDNQNHGWSDANETRAATSGSVDYFHGGTMGQPYEITVEVVNPNGITVDSGSVTYTPDGGDGTSWP